MAEMRIQIDGMFMSEKMKVEQGLNSIIKKH